MLVARVSIMAIPTHILYGIFLFLIKIILKKHEIFFLFFVVSDYKYTMLIRDLIQPIQSIILFWKTAYEYA